MAIQPSESERLVNRTAVTLSLSACTICTLEQLPHARVLQRSFERHHANQQLGILVVDAFPLPEVNSRGLLTLEEIGLSAEEAHRFAKTYRGEELARAVRPWLLRSLLRDTNPVLWFAPTIKIFAPLDEILESALRAGMVATYPQPAERKPADCDFMGVSSLAAASLEDCSAATTEALVAGRSIDGIGAGELFGSSKMQTVDDPSFNIGYWNLDPQQLEVDSLGYEIAARPLRSFNFRGFDVSQPHLLSVEQGPQPRVRLSASAALRALCAEYRNELVAAQATDSTPDHAWRSVLPSGQRIDRYMWRLYARALARYQRREGPLPPNPFSPAGERAFLKWLNQRVSDGAPIITRYMLEMHAARPDLKAAFPEPIGASATAFYDWFVTYGAEEENIVPQLSPQVSSTSASEHAQQPGSADESANVLVTGYFRAELGIGEAARLLVTGLNAAGIGYRTNTYGATENRQAHVFEEDAASSDRADIEIFCINADQLRSYFAAAPRTNPTRYVIGFWFWEVDEFPIELHHAFALVDEVWVASDFVRRALLKVSPKPVWKINLPLVRPEIDTTLTRSALRLPERFMFLFSFDFLSVMERKNPVGLVEAFKNTFRTGEGPVLVIKSINGEARIAEMERLKYAIADRADIFLLDDYMSPAEKNALTALCDCYISMHRAEGLGLAMAEAMAFRKPVIGTGYSGNLEFMNDENSYLCPSQIVEVGPGREPYPPHAHWAEPDLNEASRLMRHVYSEQEEAKARGRRAADQIEQLHSAAAAGAVARARIERVRSIRNLSERERATELLRDRLQFLKASEDAIVSALAREPALRDDVARRASSDQRA